jgi:PKD repeat protein
LNITTKIKKTMKALLTIIFLFPCLLFAQVNYTAEDQVPPYNEPFGYGINPGIAQGWTDYTLADISAGNPQLGVPGAGINTMRPWLPEWFLDYWGYDIRVPHYNYWQSLGIENLVGFLGDATEAHQANPSGCAIVRSPHFANLYEPIWDNGENGSPVNEENYYAYYVYQAVNTYKDQIRFWEVLNEPDIDLSITGFLGPGEPGNWYENIPEPCDIVFGAPIYHYVRMLRITYEVIKTVDPDAYIAVGGLGYPSFLDLILRLTDNPNGGTVTAEYPHTGGAYFDAMSFHDYPHFVLYEWNNNILGFDYFRYSDAAVDKFIEKKVAFEQVLDNYGYDGNTKPEKVWICTETNVPYNNFNPNYFGSPEGQRNYTIKLLVAAQKHKLRQLHLYQLGQITTEAAADEEFDLMGLYKNLDNVGLYNQQYTEQGLAYKTTSDLIGDATYDISRTEAMNMPPDIDGGAFLHPDGTYTYIIWARTNIDGSEVASATYSFPANLDIDALERKAWDYAQTNDMTSIAPNNIVLNGTPIFLRSTNVSGQPPQANFTYVVNSSCAPYSVTFYDNSGNLPTAWNWSFPGAVPATSNEQNPTVVYPEFNNYSISFSVSNEFGTDNTSTTTQIGNESLFELNQTLCSGQSININGTIYNENNSSGTEVIQGGSFQGCDSTVIVNLSFTSDIEENITATICEGETYLFGNQTLSQQGPYTYTGTSYAGCDSIVNLQLTVEENSTTNLDITIEQGQSYTVGNNTYTQAGTYTNVLTASNGCDSTVILHLNLAGQPPVADFTYVLNSNCPPYSVTFSDNSNNAPTDWIWSFPGATPQISNEQNPTVVYNDFDNYTINLIASNQYGSDNSLLTTPIGNHPTFELNQSLCYGQSIIVNGNIYDENNTTGIEILPGANYQGCDSTVIVNLSFSESIEQYIDVTICDNETYLFGDQVFSTAGNYTLEGTSYSGCDSTIFLELYVEPTFNTSLNVSIQQGEVFNVGNNSYSQAGTYTDVLTAANGCDSTVVLNLSVDINTATTELGQPTSIDWRCYPNPFSDEVNMSVLAEEGSFHSLAFYDTQGRQLAISAPEVRYNQGRYDWRVNFNSLPSGVYWCRLQLKNGVYTERLIKQ